MAAVRAAGDTRSFLRHLLAAPQKKVSPLETISSCCMHESGIARVRVWFQGEEQRPVN